MSIKSCPQLDGPPCTILVHNFIKIRSYPGLVKDHEELVAEGLVDRVGLPLLVAEESLQQVDKLVYVDGAVAGVEIFEIM